MEGFVIYVDLHEEIYLCVGLQWQIIELTGYMFQMKSGFSVSELHTVILVDYYL